MSSDQSQDSIDPNASTAVLMFDDALTKVKREHDFKDLIAIMQDRSFGANPENSDADTRHIARMVELALAFLKSLKPTNETMRCQALIARFYATTRCIERAIENYKQAIRTSKDRYFGNRFIWISYLLPAGAWEFETSCQIALALLYLQKGDGSRAERVYRDLTFLYTDFKGEERARRLSPNPDPRYARTGQAVVASGLGASYAAAGKNHKALQKFADMIAFESVFRYQDSANILTVAGRTRPLTANSFRSPDFDPLVGSYPSTLVLFEPYFKFAKEHPRLVNKEELEPMEEQVRATWQERYADVYDSSR